MFVFGADLPHCTWSPLLFIKVVRFLSPRCKTLALTGWRGVGKSIGFCLVCAEKKRWLRVCVCMCVRVYKCMGACASARRDCT